MPMEGQVKFLSPQNTGVSQGKAVSVVPQTMEENGDQDSNVEKKKNTK